MMNKFIYVFSENAKDDMIKNGYKLLSTVENSGSNVYIFDNSNNKFAENKFEYPYVMTNTLMF